MNDAIRLVTVLPERRITVMRSPGFNARRSDGGTGCVSVRSSASARARASRFAPPSATQREFASRAWMPTVSPPRPLRRRLACSRTRTMSGLAASARPRTLSINARRSAGAATGGPHCHRCAAASRCGRHAQPRTNMGLLARHRGQPSPGAPRLPSVVGRRRCDCRSPTVLRGRP